MVYEKPTAILAWLLEGEAFRELLIFPLALIDEDVPGQLKGNRGPIQRDRGRASDVGPIQQKIATCAGDLKIS